MSVNLATKYSPLIEERFKKQSITDAYAGKKYDFDGVQSIKIYTIDKVTLNNYSRTASGGRFGTVTELGDTIQTLTMSQDKAFTFSIDHGNAEDQYNIKHCNEQLKSNWDEVCTPAIDMYRLNVWANGAGIHTVNGTALTTETALTAIVTGNKDMNNALVPKKNRVIFISESVYIVAKLAKELIGIDSLGAQSVATGVVGRLDGCDLIPVPDSYMPAGVNFIIKYRDATVDPRCMKTLARQKNPLGYGSDVGECRFYHDAFVWDRRSTAFSSTARAGVGDTHRRRGRDNLGQNHACLLRAARRSNTTTVDESKSPPPLGIHSGAKPDKRPRRALHRHGVCHNSGLVNSGILTFTYTYNGGQGAVAPPPPLLRWRTMATTGTRFLKWQMALTDKSCGGVAERRQRGLQARTSYHQQRPAGDLPLYSGLVTTEGVRPVPEFLASLTTPCAGRRAARGVLVHGVIAMLFADENAALANYHEQKYIEKLAGIAGIQMAEEGIEDVYYDYRMYGG
jgi:hypothetical protein